jgi:hypothetical protein
LKFVFSTKRHDSYKKALNISTILRRTIISLLVILIVPVTLLHFHIHKPAQTDLNWATLGLFNNLSVQICRNCCLMGFATFSGVSAVGGVSTPADISVSGFYTVSGVPAVVGVLCCRRNPSCCADARKTAIIQLDSQNCKILAFTSTGKHSAISLPGCFRLSNILYFFLVLEPDTQISGNNFWKSHATSLICFSKPIRVVDHAF